MNHKRNFVIALLVIALAILAYVYWIDKDATDQGAINTQQNQNNNITEPPPPAPAPSPTPNPQGPDDIAPAPSEAKFANNNWLFVGLVVDGKKVDSNVNVPQAMTLNFDKAKKTYNGFAGCNSFSGSYTTSGADKVDLGAAVATKKYCMESSALENKLLGAMDKIDSYMITAEGNLILKVSDTKIEYKPAI
jgi:heat shock protein HslJ